MAETNRYRVVSACVVVPVISAAGPIMHTLYTGHVFDADPQHYRIRHNVDSGYIEEIGAGTAAADGEDGPPSAPDPAVEPGVAAEVEEKRAAARAKLPADGSVPDGRLGQDVWVEYAVLKGMDRTEAEKAVKSDLVNALKAQA